MGKQFNTRIQHKIDTYENWSKAENFIPLEGELIIYTTNESGDNETKIKIGDGKTLVKDLGFAAGGSASEEAGTNAIQSDWAQADNTQLDYIKNKPGDKIVSETSCLLTELNIETGGDTLTIPGLYTWEKKFDKQEQDCQEGDKILLTILPDNVKLESTLYTDEVTDNAFNIDNSDTGHYATFNLTFDKVLDAYVNGFIKKDENIPYRLGINIIKTEKDNSFSAYVVSAEDNLENKFIILEVVRNNEKYIKLSNNALNIDPVPTENSENLITSGGVAAALKNIDISNDNVQSDWLETDISNGGYIKNKPGDEIKEEEITNFVENYQLQEGQEVVPSVFTFGTIVAETAPQIGEKVRMFVKTSDNENIFVGEETLYHDAVLQETMGGVNDDPWACCTINSTVKNAAEAIQTGNLPIANETIPYAFAIVIVPNERGGGYITIASTENLAGLNITLQRIKTNLTTIKLANNALNIDLEPIENSDSLITSGAVYNALSASGNLIPEIYNLDDAIETGEYWYIQDELGIKNKVSVIKSAIEADGMSGFYVSQTIFPGASENGKIYSRLGYQIDNDSFKWLQDNLIETITSNDIKNSVGKSGHVLTSDTGGYWSWNKPKYVPTPKTEDIGKILTAIGTDPYEGFKWEELDKIMELPVIQDVSGFTELDKIIEDGVYKYITDNRINCILIVSSYDGTITIGNQVIGGKIVTQLLIKTIGSFTGIENIGRGLIGPGVFIRIGVGNDQYGELAFEWQNSGRFENIHDLPQAPANEGCYILNSKRDEENNELRYNWTEFNDTDLADGIVNQISTWVDGELANVAHTNITNTFTTSQTINGDLTVNGNIIQEGDNYVTHAEHVYTEDDYIILRDGAQTPLSSYAGFEIQNYDGNNTTGHLVFDNQGTARVGDIGEEEPLTTRAEANEITEGTLATWGLKNGAPVLTSGLSIKILTQTEYDSIVKNNNTLYLIKEG